MAYGTPADLALYGLSANVLASFPSGDQQNALNAASDVADGYLANRGTLPLVAPYPLALVRAVCQIAGADLMMSRGTSAESFPKWEMRADEARKWLRALGQGDIRPPGLVFSSTTPAVTTDCGGPRATSLPPRGWTSRGGC